jgi:acetylxylan esterase
MKAASVPTRATALLLLALTAATPSTAQPPACPQVHVFGARETLVPAGLGSAGLVVQLVQDAFPGATSEVIDYPAAGATPEEYAGSVRDGIAAVVRQVSDFAAACPDATLVLVGYSQGSQIMDTAFCGGPDGASLDEQVVPMPVEVGTRVAALVWMGNPRHVDGLPYNVGTAVEPGVSFRFLVVRRFPFLFLLTCWTVCRTTRGVHLPNILE